MASVDAVEDPDQGIVWRRLGRRSCGGIETCCSLGSTRNHVSGTILYDETMRQSTDARHYETANKLTSSVSAT